MIVVVHSHPPSFHSRHPAYVRVVHQDRGACQVLEARYGRERWGEGRGMAGFARFALVVAPRSAESASPWREETNREILMIWNWILVGCSVFLTVAAGIGIVRTARPQKAKENRHA